MVEWEKVGDDGNIMFEFREVNDAIEGVLVSVEESKKFKDKKVYLIESQDYGVQHIFGSKVLDKKIDAGTRSGVIGIGKPLRIVYLGEVKSKESGQKYKDFDVFVGKATPASSPEFILGEERVI